MDRENYKARYEELHEIFDQLLSAHQQVLIEIGELRTENGILMSIPATLSHLIRYAEPSNPMLRATGFKK